MFLCFSLYYKIGQMKDVRRSDGWTVNIKLGNAIAISHHRIEQNIVLGDSKDHFEVLWELRVSFDKLFY